MLDTATNFVEILRANKRLMLALGVTSKKSVPGGAESLRPKIWNDRVRDQVPSTSNLCIQKKLCHGHAQKMRFFFALANTLW
jgi:hypothetical protein